LVSALQVFGIPKQNNGYKEEKIYGWNWNRKFQKMTALSGYTVPL
jgi:hypothetical protein